MDTWSDAQLVSLEGQAVKAFLQGYLTCNSDRIEKHTRYDSLQSQGRVVANGWALGRRTSPAGRPPIRGGCAGGVSEALRMFSKCKIQVLPHDVPVLSEPQSSNAFCGDWCFGETLLNPADTDGDDQSAIIAQRLIENRFAWVSEPVAGSFLPKYWACTMWAQSISTRAATWAGGKTARARFVGR